MKINFKFFSIIFFLGLLVFLVSCVETGSKDRLNLSIVTIESDQTSISFDLDIIDKDNVGTLKAIELYQGEILVKALDDLTIRKFTNLLSDNEYTVKVSYGYDLNDGSGEKFLVKEKTITTKAKTSPEVTLKNVSSDLANVFFNLDIIDPDGVGEITSIELYEQEELGTTFTDVSEREFKGIWLSSLIGELPYQNELQYKATMNEAFDVMENYGYNALIFHVRTHNNAFYPSEINPLASWFKDVNFDIFDPLEWTINEAHNRGIEFHAWLNPYRVNKTYIVGDYPAENPASNPNNLITNSFGEFILNPAYPHVREHIYDTIEELIESYDVDAIHFDDYFYIRESINYEPYSADGKRHEINLLIEGISDLLKAYNKANNKAVQFGISPSGVYRSGDGVVTYLEDGTPVSSGSAKGGFSHYGDYLYADTIKWSIEGWIDYIVPQLYWARNHPTAPFATLSDWWNQMYKYLDTNLYLGIGVYQADEAGNTYGWKGDVNELHYQLSNVESNEHVGGYVLFSYKHLQNGYHNNGKMSGSQVVNAYFNVKSRVNYKLPPIVRNMDPIYLPNIKNITIEDNIISWDSLEGGKIYYIYQSKSGRALSYTNDEIIGMMAHKDGKMTFAIENYNKNLEYDVKVISRTNHFNGAEPEGDGFKVLVESLDDVTKRTFASLKPNQEYKIKVTYTYDLNDGLGERTIVKEEVIKTKE